MKVQLKNSIHIVHFDQNLFCNIKSIQATLRIIARMEFPVPIGIDTVKRLSESSLIRTWSKDSTKYQSTQYKHIMDHEGSWKYFLNFRESAARIMTLPGNILEKDLDKHKLW